MIEIDGAMGEGGGQVLRSSLSLAVITGQAVEVSNIRAARRRPGLMRQHLTGLLALQEICDGEVDGAQVGSQRVRLRPGPIRAGDYAFSVGTAGSTNLVLQTVVPVLLHASGASTVRVAGGTHNPAAPPYEFLQQAYLPALRAIGYEIDANLLRHGFYPAGGGEVEMTVAGRPQGLPSPLVLEARGAEQSRSLACLLSHLQPSIAQRELTRAGEALDVPPSERHLVRVASAGPGNMLYARLVYANLTAVFAEFGERGVSAEQVAKRLAKRARTYARSAAAVEHHLADQLMLPMAMAAGGCFTTLRPSRHALTNAQVIERFTDMRIRFEESGGAHRCTVAPR